MTEPREHRRLAAILAADVVGYSRLMGLDESGTFAALRARWKDVLMPTVSRHRGRVVKVMGDGVLVEFASPIDAVECAVALQKRFDAANCEVAQDRHIVLRIGINLGDVIVQGSDLFGDGVNIAARLESIAEPGGICVSAKVFAEIRGKVAVGLVDAGEVVLKNIASPMRVYRIAPHNPDPQTAPVGISPPLDKPSIAVLPFENMSGDAEQDYFADGVVEDIITALSRRRQLFVIARNSSFIYKGHAVDVKQVGRELGVRYVLEGSLRRAGERLRITAQLIDTANGSHLWAERYDGALADVFDLQDRIASSIAGAIIPTVELAEIALARSKPPGSTDAYDSYLRGAASFLRRNAEGISEALSHFLEAIRLDPSYAAAYAFAGHCYTIRMAVSSGSVSEDDMVQAERMALKAVELAPNDDLVLTFAASTIGCGVGDVRRGLLLGERALALNPNYAHAWLVHSWNNLYAGRFPEALEGCERAMRLSPQDPISFQMDACTAHVHFTAGRSAEALAWAERAMSKRSTNPDILVVLVASLVGLGRDREAKEALRHYREVDPQCRLRNLPAEMPFLNQQHLLLWVDALRQAGMPE